MARVAEAYGLYGLVLTLGDQPRMASIVRDLDTLSAIEYLRRAGIRVRLGALLSLRYSLEDILSRLRAPADFYLVLRLSWGDS